MHKQLNVSLVIRKFSRRSSSTEIPERILSHQRVFLPGLTQCLFTIRPDFLFGISLNVDLSIISLVCLVRFLVANSCINNAQVFVKTERKYSTKIAKIRQRYSGVPFLKKAPNCPKMSMRAVWVLKRSEKVPESIFTRHRQGFRFHLAPFRNRFQIAPVKVTFSYNFDPVPCERNCVL